MQSLTFEEVIKKIVAADPRYPYEAYAFVQEALHFTPRSLGRHKTDQKHVGGKELLDGIRDYALKSFGPMVPTVFGEWGIHSCEDFGEIVFNMIEHNLATKTATDTRDDFKGCYTFEEAFRKPFLPAKSPPRKSRPEGAKV
jgi:uncharacterized repeat protein (TIGR04138 family)